MAAGPAKVENTRYYENSMPAIGDLVMAKVVKNSDTSAYVQLLEFNNMEGMIPYTELSRRRIRSVNQVAKLGKLQVAVVIRVDKDKQYIDLSKKQVTAEERKKCEERFIKSKKVTQIMQRVAVECGLPVLKVMQAVAWPLYQTHGHAFDALKLAVTDPASILDPLKLDEKVKERVCAGVQHRLKAEVLKIQADIDVTCFTIEGVDAIRAVLRIGQEAGQADGTLQVHVHVLAPPTYVLYTQTEDKEEGLKKLWDCIDAMKKAMEVKGGSVNVPVPPRVIGQEDADDKDGQVVAGSSDDEDDA